MARGKGRKRETQEERDRRRAQEQRLQRLTTYTGIGVLAVVVLLVGLYVVQSRTGGGLGAGSSGPASFSLEDEPRLGEPDAPVTVVEFIDFKCPACKQFHDLVFDRFKEDFIDTGKVKLYVMHFPIPLGPDSYTAAVAGECLYRQRPAAFWPYYDAMFRYQGDERERWVTLERLRQVVRDYVKPLVDVDEEAFLQCVREDRYRREVDQDKREALAAGVRGTPTLFVDGQMVRRWYPYSSFKAALERALQEAESASR